MCQHCPPKKPTSGLKYPILSILLAGGFITFLFLMAGCATGSMGMGTRTELYTSFHAVPVKEHPSTPNEWQAKANNECLDTLMAWRLPDTNFGWKYARGMTFCGFSSTRNECVCSGPTTVSYPERKWPNEVRFSTLP